MIFLIFIVGSLFGLLGGALVSMRFIRRGVAEDLLPRISGMQGQLNTIEAEVGYLVNSRYAELNARLPENPPRQPA